MEEDHVRALALLASERTHATRLEPHPRRRMPSDRLVHVAVDLAQPARRPDVAARHVHLANRRHCADHGIRKVRIRRLPRAGTVANLDVSVPLTRPCEAKKGRVNEKVVLDRDDLRRTLVRIAHEIVEKNASEALAIVGIHTRGAIVARRLHTLVGELTGDNVPLGDIDISFYRDDIEARGPSDSPIVHASHLDFEMDGRTVVLVDDVLFTGRTVRAAIDALFDYGRPERIQLAVLADRGHRELPFRADYVGKNLPTSRDERVFVRLEEHDEVDEVAIGSGTPVAAATQGDDE